ncbi:histidine phosphatase family protein [Actimicrobium sp. CCI2.3]|uniref:histidine phosphatase family protein n=1 Tax=Actimicrobium sp. CCI2.3 TaxID=3048616 RepID=UPI002AB575B1|nr:histidine phosphatase family protein [Actimicrobium sp. CCI2.3]MDY7573475.1 histidine phosphatase family protein [Actimicrobium sp. CCI2.3]MEB0022656.1 histidine phosphatase family protein [Actimicrobium sp. CCI2.3]
MTELLLIRHGETDWNAERRLQGFLDIGLNDRGRQQAVALALALRDEALDAVIASDLQRAVHTAQALALPRGLTVQTDACLRERCYGAFEGLLYDEIAGHFPQAHASWMAREVDARFPPGQQHAETLREFSARAVDSIIAIARRHAGQKIAIVTHGGVLDCVYRAARGVGLDSVRDFDIINTGINRFHWDGKVLSVLQWGNVAHLGQVALDEASQ